MNTNFELDDPLDELFGGSSNGSPRPMARELPAAAQAAAFVETCLKCRGTGRFVRGNFVGECFSCKGEGNKTFRTSATARAKSRDGAAERKAQQIEDFKTAHPAEFAWMLANPNFEFAKSMFDALRKWGSLTEKQLAAVQRCVAREAVRNAEREERKANAPTVDATKIEEAFAHARAKAARPGMKGVWTRPLPLTSGDITVEFQAGKGKWEGTLFVKRDDRDIGRIADGKFSANFKCTDAEQAAVLDCAANPTDAAKAFAKAWSRCCVCGKTLTNDESIGRGMGDVCAAKFGW